MAGVERDGVLAVQNAYLSYHLVRRNIIRSKVHVNGYLKNDEDLNTSAHLALENHRFQQAVKALEKANDEFMDRHKHEVMQLVKTLDISDSQLHAQFQKAAGQVIVDEIRWGRIASLFFFTSILAERLIIVGQGNKVKELVKWLSLFLNNHVSHWIKAQGGWELICDILRPPPTLKLSTEWLSLYLSVEGHRGGFRNLLLDGWWLEFWEIILLAAGDVERNPGPRRMTDEQLISVDNRALEKSDLFDVYDAVHGCRVNWHNLCLALRISDNDLSAINREQSGDIEACLRKGLSIWLQRGFDVNRHGPPSWRMLVDAVANSTGGNDHKLALDIAEQHKVIESSASKCDDLERSKQMSSAFGRMYRSVIQLLRVNVREVKEIVRFLSDPRRLCKPCVPIDDYKYVTSTRDLLTHLYKDGYINPENTFVLEEIVASCGSGRCKELVRKYTDEFHNYNLM